MNIISKRLLVVLSAFAVALFSRYIIYSWQAYSIIPWALISFVIGLISISKKAAIFNGVIFGYFLSSFYLFSDYAGKNDIASVTKVTGVILAISLVGGIGGTIASVTGNLLRTKIQKLRNSN